MTIGLTVLALLTIAPATVQAAPFVNGDVIAGFGQQGSPNTSGLNQFSPNGTLKDTLNDQSGSSLTTGMCFDADRNLYVTNFDAGTVSKFDAQGNLIASSFASGSNEPESCVVAANGDVLVGGPGGDVFRVDSTGAPVTTYATGRSDWIDLAADQCTLFYTNEGPSIMRFDVCANQPLSNFADGLVNCYALRILPSGSGVLAACGSQVVRLDAAGTVVQTYPIPGVSILFALNLDPDGQTFWTADILTAEVYRVDIATGNVITQFSGAPGLQVGGLAVVGELTSHDADLSLTKADSPDPVSVGQSFTYTLTASNAGPVAQATGVTVEDTVPAGVTFQSANASQGSCVQSAGTVSCNLGNLAKDASATVTITVTPQAGGTITNTATVSGEQRDPNSANNTATAQTTVQTQPFTLVLTPSSATNALGTTHTVTATLTQGGSAINGQTILFGVTGANTASGSRTTDGSGNATFSYTGTNVGSDTITTCHDANGSGTCDAGEATATATKTWTGTTGGTNGRMTGGGTLVGTSVHHGFELNCDKTKSPNHLEVNWGRGNRFHLESLASAACSDDPSINEGHPGAGFDTYRGSGTGTYNRAPGAMAQWVMTDAGEPGRNDTFQIKITDASGNVVLDVSGKIQGNHQAHRE
jgi:uncharacterized repeat protein (TIGR01451 family)